MSIFPLRSGQRIALCAVFEPDIHTEHPALDPTYPERRVVASQHLHVALRPRPPGPRHYAPPSTIPHRHDSFPTRILCKRRVLWVLQRGHRVSLLRSVKSCCWTRVGYILWVTPVDKAMLEDEGNSFSSPGASQEVRPYEGSTTGWLDSVSVRKFR